MLLDKTSVIPSRCYLLKHRTIAGSARWRSRRTRASARCFNRLAVCVESFSRESCSLFACKKEEDKKEKWQHFDRPPDPRGAQATEEVAFDRFQSDKSDPSVIAFSEIKRCQLPHSTRFFKKQKSRRTWSPTGTVVRTPVNNFE